jgi:glycosyltransferase involved in cell wall biosynthesis
VSVVVAARDAARTAPAAVASVLAQDVTDLEVVVVDDGSVDGTREAVEALGDPRVRVLRSERSRGRAAARNLAVDAARADWIAVQDADDVSLPGRLRRTLGLAAAEEDLAVVSGQAVFEAPRLGEWRLRRYPLHDVDIRAELEQGSMALFHGGCLVRRSLFDRVGGYDERCVRAQDLNLMMRLAQHGRFAAVDADVARYRHPVVLPPWYWWESRRYTRVAVAHARGRDLPQAPHPVEALRYLPAMSRRLLRRAAR